VGFFLEKPLNLGIRKFKSMEILEAKWASRNGKARRLPSKWTMTNAWAMGNVLMFALPVYTS
jgi:hypothetical protein